MTATTPTLIDEIAARTARVVVIGQGYVGLPVAMRASAVGFTVTALEASPERAAALMRGQSYVGDITDEVLHDAIARGYHVSSDPSVLEGFDIAVISVPTPLRDGSPDVSFIEAAAADLGRALRPGCCVILESTTYPGTTTELVVPILCRESGLSADQFDVGYSPERIDPGNPTHTLVNTPKVVSGTTPQATEVVDAFYSTLVDVTVVVGSCAEAELVKLLENTFRHVNIALVNEIAMFARDLDVDIWRAIDAADTKPFGYMKFTPGPGVGGHCLPVDPSYLAWRVEQHLGRSFRFVELANDVNRHMPQYVVDRADALAHQHGFELTDSNVVLLGLAYKANTSDWRESPSVGVAEHLVARGANVVFCDPHVVGPNAATAPHPLVEFSADTLNNADLVIVLVDHDDFEPDMIVEHSRVVLDTKRLLVGHEFRGETL